MNLIFRYFLYTCFETVSFKMKARDPRTTLLPGRATQWSGGTGWPTIAASIITASGAHDIAL